MKCSFCENSKREQSKSMPPPSLSVSSVGVVNELQPPFLVNRHFQTDFLFARRVICRIFVWSDLNAPFWWQQTDVLLSIVWREGRGGIFSSPSLSLLGFPALKPHNNFFTQGKGQVEKCACRIFVEYCSWPLCNFKAKITSKNLLQAPVAYHQQKVWHRYITVRSAVTAPTLFLHHLVFFENLQAS